MAGRFRREVGLVVGWLVFPLMPVVLEDFYCRYTNPGGFDPHEWHGWLWADMLGPLLGFGFLAGATAELPDASEPPGRWWRRLLARRSVWVAVAPWCGPFVWIAVIEVFIILENLLKGFASVLTAAAAKAAAGSESGGGPISGWVGIVLGWCFLVLLTVIWSYAWLWPACAALRCAARIGRFWRAFYRGLAVATAFVGSLFGSFWAATAWWRSYYFNTTLVPMMLLAVGLLTMSGCANTITYGELRRRELFHAMLVAWVIGLALLWRWWSRSRPGGPGGKAAD